LRPQDFRANRTDSNPPRGVPPLNRHCDGRQYCDERGNQRRALEPVEEGCRRFPPWLRRWLPLHRRGDESEHGREPTTGPLYWLAIPGSSAPLELQLGPIGPVSESAQLLLGKATLLPLSFYLDEARRGAGSNFSGEGDAVFQYSNFASETRVGRSRRQKRSPGWERGAS
jgi:hypothetical protein